LKSLISTFILYCELHFCVWRFKIIILLSKWKIYKLL